MILLQVLLWILIFAGCYFGSSLGPALKLAELAELEELEVELESLLSFPPVEGGYSHFPAFASQERHIIPALNLKSLLKHFY